MTFAGSGATDENGIALQAEEGAVGELSHQRLIDRGIAEVEVAELFVQR